MKIKDLIELLKQYPQHEEFKLWMGYCPETGENYYYDIEDIQDVLENREAEE